MQIREKYRLGENIELVGYSLTTNAATNELIQPGQAVTVTLYWQALEPVSDDYSVFIHLLDTEGQLHGQHDGPPVNGRYPAHSWLPNQTVKDETVLVLDPDLPPGDYRVAVGLYSLETGQRLEVRGGSGNMPNNAIVLDPALRVGSPR
jgi:hypothetical protein